MITRAPGFSRRARRASLQTLRVGAIGNGAGVDHVNVGDLVELGALHARARQAELR